MKDIMLELFWSNLGNRHCSLCPEGSVHTQQCLKTFPSHLSCSNLTLRTDTALSAQRGLSLYAAVSEDISVSLQLFRSNFENRHYSLCQEGSVRMQQCLKTFPSCLSCSDLTLRTDTALSAQRGLSLYAAVSEDIPIILELF